MERYSVHPLSDVQSVKIGGGTTIWQYVVVLPGASIGRNCNICSHCFFENDVVIGDNVTIKNGVFLWDGIVIEENVFIGPNSTFTNDLFPRSKAYPIRFQPTIIGRNATIGANATILCGIEIGSYALIGAGAVVTKSVPSHALLTGNPGRISGWVDEFGKKLVECNGELESADGRRFKIVNHMLVQL